MKQQAKLGNSILSRRQFLARSGLGFGALSLAGLMAQDYFGAGRAMAGSPLAPKLPHYPGKAKAVIQVFASGAPSHIDTFDPKPELIRQDGKPLPGMGGVAFASPFQFAQHGQSGLWVSELFPKLAAHADELAVIRSMWTDIPDHDTGTTMMNTGATRVSRPSVGSWVLYGLGSENRNLPGFISLRPGGMPTAGTKNWQSAFLPGVYQGTSVNTMFEHPNQMVENIRNEFLPLDRQRMQLDLVQQLNSIHSRNLQQDPQLEARIESLEMSFKMQTEALEAFDLGGESESALGLYESLYTDYFGAQSPRLLPEGRQLLIARRLVERGVRFVQVWHNGWDHHSKLEDGIRRKAGEIDGPLAGLLADLKQRGLLDSTLVVWGGEFGRTPTKDRNGGTGAGRDHNQRAFSVWLAGGGIKGGTPYGTTDELGARAVEDKVHVHDLHATILALLGINHEKLTFRYNGRDFRLTDTSGRVVREIIA
jgi:hypothetical protein